MGRIKLFCGRTHVQFAQKISDALGLPLANAVVKQFADSEVYVKINEKVRGDDIFVIQPTSRPVNESLMELLIMIEALRRSNVARINVVMPYYGYARQDRRATAREPITAKLVANLITRAGADRIITVDLHSPQIVGFFDIDVDHFEAYPVYVDYIKKKNLQNVVAVASDTGFVKKTRNIARLLESPLAIIDKRRPTHNKAEVVNVIGEVKDKTCILVDDIIDTAGTITAAANALKQHGAAKVYICATHGVLSDPAIQRLQECDAEEIVLTDSVPIPADKCIKKMTVLSIADLMAEVIKRIHDHKSLGELFSWEDGNARKSKKTVC